MIGSYGTVVGGAVLAAAGTVWTVTGTVTGDVCGGEGATTRVTIDVEVVAAAGAADGRGFFGTAGRTAVRFRTAVDVVDDGAVAPDGDRAAS